MLMKFLFFKRIGTLLCLLLFICNSVYAQLIAFDSLKNEIALNKKTLNFRLKEIKMANYIEVICQLVLQKAI